MKRWSRRQVATGACSLFVASLGALALPACGETPSAEDTGSTHARLTTWVECATEGGTCSFAGTRAVRYGTATANVTKTFTTSTRCTNQVFGDPAPGVLKKCWYAVEEPDGSWTECATEHGFCAFTGTKQVRYGTTTQNVVQTKTDGVACENAVFGDPAEGSLKKCWVASGGTTAPAPEPAPTPAPSTSWIRCATEWETCSFSGTRAVRYGTEAKNVVVTKTGPVPCTNAVFGDPAEGELKSCWYASTEGTAPAPTPTPAPTGTAGPRVSSFTSSGPITATSGQIIAGVRISNPGGPCIVIPSGATNVVVRDSDIGPCGGNGNIFIEGANATVEHTFVHNGNRGVFAHRTSGTRTRASRFDTFYGPKFNGTAIEYDYMGSGEIDANVVRGSAYASDAVSVFESSNVRLTNNDIDIDVAEPSAAAFTMGDATNGNPGGNNYVAYNTVRQTGGVPAGVFGSTGNTILEKNCLTAGIQAYNYSGTFVGVTVRSNVIKMSASFVPDPGLLAGWSTNIDGTDCSRVPK